MAPVTCRLPASCLRGLGQTSNYRHRWLVILHMDDLYSVITQNNVDMVFVGICFISRSSCGVHFEQIVLMYSWTYSTTSHCYLSLFLSLCLSRSFWIISSLERVSFVFCSSALSLSLSSSDLIHFGNISSRHITFSEVSFKCYALYKSRFTYLLNTYNHFADE